MDDQRFDRFARAFSSCTSRRQAVRLLAATAALGVGLPRFLAAQDASAQMACGSGLTDCGGICIDLQSDMNNCGACGSVCERANCPVGIEYCGAVDDCRDLSSDPAHCGACGNACASGVCSGGVCSTGGGACAEGQANCGGVCVDTCCNNDHCGACGNACPPGTSCFEGICDCPSGLCCAEGEVICDGACVATCCDNNNCGACGNVCPPDLTCFEGVCDCPSGNCPPTKLPDTGHGSAARAERAPWVAAAMAGAAAAGALWLRVFSRSKPEGKPDSAAR